VIALAAALDLLTPGRLLVLMGAWGAFAPRLHALVPIRAVLIDSPVLAEHDDAPTMPIVGGTARAVAPAQVDGVAIGPDAISAAQLEAAAGALRTGGRLVLPAGVPMPDGVTSLAADDVLHVGVRETVPSAPVSLRRAPRP
jgi:hypothetical protein